MMKLKIFCVGVLLLSLCTACANNNAIEVETSFNQSAPPVETASSEVKTEVAVNTTTESEKEKFPFLEKDGYMYWLEIQNQEPFSSPALYNMYRAKLDGSEQTLLDETVFAKDAFWSGTIVGDADVFVFDDRIVFLGLPNVEVDSLDNIEAIKGAKPTFVSIAFDGSGRKAFERFVPDFQNPINIDDYIYFGEINYSNETNPVNRVRYDFEKYEKVLDIDGFFITLKNDNIYYIDSDGLNIFSVPKSGGEATTVYTFPKAVSVERALNEEKTSWEFVATNNSSETTQVETYQWDVPVD